MATRLGSFDGAEAALAFWQRPLKDTPLRYSLRWFGREGWRSVK